MSVIIEDHQTDTISLLCKGADSIIVERLDRSNTSMERDLAQVQNFIDQDANEGLRTLLLAERTLNGD